MALGIADSINFLPPSKKLLQLASGKKGSRPIHATDLRTTKFYKTKLCPFMGSNKGGRCTHGLDCGYAHSESELRDYPSLRCTKWCHRTLQGFECKDQNCSYAHSATELNLSNDARTLKTSVCSFWKKRPDLCLNGDKCRFAHGEHELRPRTTLSPRKVSTLISSQSTQDLGHENNISWKSTDCEKGGGRDKIASITTDALSTSTMEHSIISTIPSFQSTVDNSWFSLHKTKSAEEKDKKSSPMRWLPTVPKPMEYPQPSDLIERCSTGNQIDSEAQRNSAELDFLSPTETSYAEITSKDIGTCSQETQSAPQSPLSILKQHFSQLSLNDEIECDKKSHFDGRNSKSTDFREYGKQSISSEYKTQKNVESISRNGAIAHRPQVKNFVMAENHIDDDVESSILKLLPCTDDISKSSSESSYFIDESKFCNPNFQKAHDLPPGLTLMNSEKQDKCSIGNRLLLSEYKEISPTYQDFHNSQKGIDKKNDGTNSTFRSDDVRKKMASSCPQSMKHSESSRLQTENRKKEVSLPKNKEKLDNSERSRFHILDSMTSDGTNFKTEEKYTSNMHIVGSERHHNARKFLSTDVPINFRMVVSDYSQLGTEQRINRAMNEHCDTPAKPRRSAGFSGANWNKTCVKDREKERTDDHLERDQFAIQGSFSTLLQSIKMSPQQTTALPTQTENKTSFSPTQKRSPLSQQKEHKGEGNCSKNHISDHLSKRGLVRMRERKSEEDFLRKASSSYKYEENEISKSFGTTKGTKIANLHNLSKVQITEVNKDSSIPVSSINAPNYYIDHSSTMTKFNGNYPLLPPKVQKKSLNANAPPFVPRVGKLSISKTNMQTENQCSCRNGRFEKSQTSILHFTPNPHDVESEHTPEYASPKKYKSNSKCLDEATATDSEDICEHNTPFEPYTNSNYSSNSREQSDSTENSFEARTLATSNNRLEELTCALEKFLAMNKNPRTSYFDAIENLSTVLLPLLQKLQFPEQPEGSETQFSQSGPSSEAETIKSPHIFNEATLRRKYMKLQGKNISSSSGAAEFHKPEQEQVILRPTVKQNQKNRNKGNFFDIASYSGGQIKCNNEIGSLRDLVISNDHRIPQDSLRKLSVSTWTQMKDKENLATLVDGGTYRKNTQKQEKKWN